MTYQMITYRLPIDYSLISLISSISYVWLLAKKYFIVSGARFSKFPVITGPIKLFVFHSRGNFKRFGNCTVKLSAKGTKWTSSEVRKRPTFHETLISKSDSGPVLTRVF